jgi:hypothetical protein
MHESLWPKLAGLPLEVTGYELERLDAGEDRKTDLVHLHGGGLEGQSEDVTPATEPFDPSWAPAPPLELSGSWTLESFCDHLGSVSQWVTEPRWDMARRWRNWAYEAAALDLALRQAGRSLEEVLGLEARPVRFVNSLGLGDPPATDTIHSRLSLYPGLRFKLDAVAAWTVALMEDLAATRAVDIIDFKGRYELEVEDEAALLRLYDNVLEAFPDALLEDPHDDRPEIVERLAPHADRVSYDSPIATAADVRAQPLRPQTINVKPMRTGNLRALFDLYAFAGSEGIAMYGGGMGELGPGRTQIQRLASLVHPDGPNDIAPSGFNDPDPAAGLPPSPLPPRAGETGFR